MHMPKARTARTSSASIPTETVIATGDLQVSGPVEGPSEVWQARLSKQDADELRSDLETLGLRSRSELIKAGLQLLHRQASEERMAADVKTFYGDHPVPLSPFVARSPQRPVGS